MAKNCQVKIRLAEPVPDQTSLTAVLKAFHAEAVREILKGMELSEEQLNEVAAAFRKGIDGVQGERE